MNERNSSSNKKDGTTPTKGMKLFVESEEDRYENEQKEDRPKSSFQMNDTCDFDILNLCSPNATKGMKLFVESEEDRHENEQKEDRPKFSSRMNDTCDFDILNLCSPKALIRQVSITVEEGKIEVFSDAEEEEFQKKYYNHNDESPYELKSISKECSKFTLPLDTRRSPECLV